MTSLLCWASIYTSVSILRGVFTLRKGVLSLTTRWNSIKKSTVSSSSFNHEFFYIHRLSIYHFGLEGSLQWKNYITENVRLFFFPPFLFSFPLLFHLTTDTDFKLSLSPRVELRFKHFSSVWLRSLINCTHLGYIPLLVQKPSLPLEDGGGCNSLYNIK